LPPSKPARSISCSNSEEEEEEEEDMTAFRTRETRQTSNFSPLLRGRRRGGVRIILTFAHLMNPTSAKHDCLLLLLLRTGSRSSSNESTFLSLVKHAGDTFATACPIVMELAISFIHTHTHTHNI